MGGSDMKNIARKLIPATLVVLLSGHAYAGDVVVISHIGITLSANDVRDIFLGDKQFAGSTKLTPVDNAALQENFLETIIRMPGAKYASTWTKRAFRDGLTAPAVKSGDASVIEFVKRTPGAVGYVSSAPAGVNVVK
jgi:ABC-type phosphate transport system substrate-binding protein